MLSTKNTSSYTFFFFNDTATTEIYTLSLHDALPISVPAVLDPLVPDEQREHRRGRGHRDERPRSEEHTSESQSQSNLVCRLLLEKKKKKKQQKLNIERQENEHSMQDKQEIRAKARI